MLDLIDKSAINIDYSELGAYGINHNFISDTFATKELLQYLKFTKKLFYSSQQVIFNQSAQADAMYIIVTGMVKLLTYLPNGKARIVRLHGPGSVLGLTGMFNQKYEHKAVAIHDVVLLKIATYSLQSLCNQSPDKLLGIVKNLFESLNLADTWITQFSTGSIKARVARLITFLSYLETETSPDVVQLLTCEDMASVIGVTPESVSRILAEFKRQKVLQRIGEAGEIYRRDPQILMKLSQDAR
jgi:CRP/FNR family transcriptional regulator